MTKTTQYKNTPIGPIPTEWEVKKLGDIAEIKTGDKDTQDKIDDGLYPFFVRSDTVERINSFSYEGEAILTSGDGVGVGKNFHYINGKFDFHQRVYSIRKFEDTLGLYIYYYFSNNFYKRVQRLSAKNSVDSVRMEMIADMPIPLPPLPEQQKIAEVLSTWDKAIQETDAIIKKLEDRNKALANKLFEENNWQISKLSDLFDRITDKNKEGNTTVTTISAKHGFIRQEDFFNKTVASKDLSNYYLINKGDFCYNKSYSKDYDWGVVKRLNDFEKAVVTTLYICFRFKDNSQNSDFWELYFENKILDKALSKVAQEGGRAHGLLNVTSGDFFGIKVKVPSLEEQNAIAEILNTANQEVKQYQQKLEALKLQKKGLMQQLLTGKVRTV